MSDITPETEHDPFDLARFLAAQEGVFPKALAELRAGRKRSHWMWFIFPQIRGLGSSPTARKYAIQSLDEARAYLDHPILSSRLLECCDALLAVEGRSAREIMGHPDDLKLRSAMTLFHRADPSERRFTDLLEKFFDGQEDPRTLEWLPSSDAEADR